jgi:hypothetical protein
VSALVRWLPNIVEATADDVARFGPNAARVRALLDFLPTMSYEASDTSDILGARLFKNNPQAEKNAAAQAQWVMRNDTNNLDFAVRNAAKDKTNYVFSAMPAALAEAAGPRYLPDTYNELINPLATGRAVDVLRTRPRLQDTPFLDVVRDMRKRGAITSPEDVVVGSRLAQSNDDVREIALILMADGQMTAEEAYKAALRLA